jgi:hypothetical protein
VQITSLCIAPISREAISRSAAIQRGRRGNGSICWQCRTISRLFLVRDVGTQCNLFARSRVSMSFPSCVFSYVRPAAMSRPKRSLRRNELTNLFENPAAGALGAKPRGCCQMCGRALCQPAASSATLVAKCNAGKTHHQRRGRFRMYSSRSFVVCAAAVAMLAGASVALARDWTDERDYGLTEHQTDLDQQYARTRPTVTPGAPVRNGTSYGYVSPRHPRAKRPLASARTPRQ